ncbi:MAG: ABC transporter ATP-binding protein [Polyangiaceae bacterium]|jgi:iron complex transport system ATP-binding protein|nr:ABC transporter ATP-binding protein [Polyangiaceae bacterium]
MSARGGLEAKGLEVRRGERTILARLDLGVAPGELVALLGPNGAGKSSLLGALAGLLPIARGEILVAGRSLSQLGVRERARWLTLVPQETQIPFELPVEEVVALGRTPHLGRFAPLGAADRQAIHRALVALDVLHLAGRSICRISGGERQRVHLARAHAQDAPVWLLDEPTSSLDLEHQLRVMNVLRRMTSEGRSMLVALHDLNMAARFADRLVVVAAGRIVAQGAPREVLREGLLAEVFRVKARCELREGTVEVSPIEALDQPP